MRGLWTEIGQGGASFVATRLSLLARALAEDTAIRRPALDALLTIYWKPLYAYVRAQGNGNEESKDHVQGFLVHLLEKQFLAKFDPKLGRFRFFLLGHLRGYLGDSRDRDRAKKRGGGSRGVPLDEKLVKEQGGRSAEELRDMKRLLSAVE